MLWWSVVATNLRRYFPDVLPVTLGMVGFVFELFFKMKPDAAILGVCAGLVGSPLFTSRDRGRPVPHVDQHQQWDEEAERQELMALRAEANKIEQRLQRRHRRRKTTSEP